VVELSGVVTCSSVGGEAVGEERLKMNHNRLGTSI